jgi:hypothetical protein
MDGGFAWTDSVASTGSAHLAYSTDGGSTWSTCGEGWFFPDTNPANGWGNSHRTCTMALTDGTTYDFGIRPVSTGGTFTVTASRCQVRAAIVLE